MLVALFGFLGGRFGVPAGISPEMAAAQSAPKARSDRAKITVDHVSVDYGAFFKSKGSTPPQIRIYLRNQTSVRARGRYAFKLSLSESGIDSRFLRGLSSLDNDDAMLFVLQEYGERPESSPQLAAYTAFLGRGMRLPEGVDFEPVDRPNGTPYTATLYANVDLHPGESEIIEMPALMPPRYHGYLVSVEQSLD